MAWSVGGIAFSTPSPSTVVVVPSGLTAPIAVEVALSIACLGCTWFALATMPLAVPAEAVPFAAAADDESLTCP